jgi:hypothetical protein
LVLRLVVLALINLAIVGTAGQSQNHHSIDEAIEFEPHKNPQI